jgi:rhamnulokinase
VNALRLAAVDLGATSGRVMVADVASDALDLREVHRFPNAAVPVGNRLLWDILALYRGMLTGL